MYNKNPKSIRQSVGSTGYPSSYTQPDQAMSIGELIERHLDAGEVSNHESQAVEDLNIDSPMRIDTDLTDVKTRYQDPEYFNDLEMMARGISADTIESNPNVHNNEKVSPNPPENLPSDSSVG